MNPLDALYALNSLHPLNPTNSLHPLNHALDTLRSLNYSLNALLQSFDPSHSLDALHTLDALHASLLRDPLHSLDSLDPLDDTLDALNTLDHALYALNSLYAAHALHALHALDALHDSLSSADAGHTLNNDVALRLREARINSINFLVARLKNDLK